MIGVAPAILAGLFGGFSLALSRTLILANPDRTDWSSAKLLSSTLVGGAMGPLFFAVSLLGPLLVSNLAAWPVAFAIWQIPVGLTLARGMRPRAAGAV